MKYHRLEPISRTEAEALLREGTPWDVTVTLLRLSYHEPDRRCVEDLCVRYSEHPEAGVRCACATAFGHLARIHGQLDLEKVMPIINRLLSDPKVAGAADDTMDDFETFLKREGE